MNEQQCMGAAVALLCGIGWYHQRWLITETAKGRRLVQWFGNRGGTWVLRGLLGPGIVFALLLAHDVNRRRRGSWGVGSVGRVVGGGGGRGYRKPHAPRAAGVRWRP